MNIIILVECFAWADYVNDPECLDTALLQNSWADEESLATMLDADKKNVLISKLNKNLNGEVQTLSDLSMRPVNAEVDGLCGIAAIYQALLSTVLTKSQLRTLDYESMKKHMIEMIGHFSSYTYTHYQVWKKDLKKNDKLLLDKYFLGSYIIHKASLSNKNI